MKLYKATGRSYLVCPRLLDLDARHGEHWSKGPSCRHGGQCPADHEHETHLVDPEGHRVADVLMLAGSRPLTDDEHPVCPCGQKLVWTDLDDLYDEQLLLEAAVGEEQEPEH